jgi:hypothetical protein
MTSTGPQTVALAVLDLAQAGRFADIRDRFTPSLRPMVTADPCPVARRPRRTDLPSSV